MRNDRTSRANKLACGPRYDTIPQIRPILDHNSAILLANELVTQRLEFCNSLYAGLSKSSLNKLQLVQNSLARSVCLGVRKFDHVTSVLHKFHWLPIESRVTFKVALITYKVLHNSVPQYLFNFLTPYHLPRQLRSTSQHLLTVPRVSTATGCRSFAFCAPTNWHSAS